MVPFLGHPVYTNGASNVGYITDTGVYSDVDWKVPPETITSETVGEANHPLGTVAPLSPYVATCLIVIRHSMDITGIKRQIFCCKRERYTVQLLNFPGFAYTTCFCYCRSIIAVDHGSPSCKNSRLIELFASRKARKVPLLQFACIFFPQRLGTLTSGL